MTIKELKDLLDKFNDDDVVKINDNDWTEDITHIYRSPFTGEVIIYD